MLNQAKRLWKESLKHFTPDQILRAARRVIEDSEYLPTVQRMLRACEESLTDEGLPGFREAYDEAANAPSPKAAQHWSHPAVYHAGRTVGWYKLNHLPEKSSYPLFAKAYREMLQRVLAGEDLRVEGPALLEEGASPPLDKDKGREKLASLRKILEE